VWQTLQMGHTSTGAPLTIDQIRWHHQTEKVVLLLAFGLCLGRRR
jgi:hypothetical protein